MMYFSSVTSNERETLHTRLPCETPHVHQIGNVTSAKPTSHVSTIVPVHEQTQYITVSINTLQHIYLKTWVVYNF